MHRTVSADSGGMKRKGVYGMPNYLAVFQNNMLATAQNRYVAKELMELSDKTEEYGIVLSGRDCQEIAEFRAAALAENERIEVGVGAVKRIIEEFCDSGYVNQNNFKETVEGLLECFYTIKSETDDKVSDDEAIEFLKYLFETEAGGDINKLYDSEAFDIFINGQGNGRSVRTEKNGKDREQEL